VRLDQRFQRGGPGVLRGARSDPCSVKAAMGHSRITTTERYLHARSAGQMADRFTRALPRQREPTSGAARETAL